MTADEIRADAEKLAAYVRKCRNDEELIDLLAAKLSVVHTAGKIAGGESLGQKLGLTLSEIK